METVQINTKLCDRIDLSKERGNEMSVVEQLRELQIRLIEEYPVSLALSIRDGNLHLHTIQIERSQRNLGYGTQVLRKLCDFADQNKLSITLTPDSSLGGNKRRLEKWYRTFGFKKNKDYRFMDSMMREATL